MPAPDMPAAPAPGAVVSSEEVFNAAHTMRTRRKRLGHDTPEAKRQRGDNIIRFDQIVTAAAVNHPNNVLQQMLEEVRASREEVRAVRAGQRNVRLRAHNLRALSLWPEQNVELQPLFREQPAASAAGGAAAGGGAAGGGAAAGGGEVAGDLPPAGVFPATCRLAHDLSPAKLARLQTFYGEQFAGSNVHQRRLKFLEFIKS